MVRISFLLILMVVLVVAVVFSYKLFYTYQINKRIKSGEIQGGSLVDLSKMVMIAIIVGLVLFCALLMYIVHDYSSQTYTVTSRNDYAVIDVSDEENYKYVSYFGNQQLEDASFAKVYNKDVNEGYVKEVIQSGEYVFTVFTRTSPADSFHPDFFCFAEFVGDKKEELVSFSKAGFHSLREESNGFYGESAGDIEDCLLYIGKLEEECYFDIQINLLDNEAEVKYNEAMQAAYDEDKGDFPEAEEFAVSSAKVSIVVE